MTLLIFFHQFFSCDRSIVENYQPIEYQETQQLKDAEVCYFQGTLMKESLNKFIFTILNGVNINQIIKAYMQITLEVQTMKEECKDVTLENFEQFIRKHSTSQQNICLDQLEDIARKVIDIINILDTPLNTIIEDIKQLILYAKNIKKICNFSDWRLNFQIIIN